MCAQVKCSRLILSLTATTAIAAGVTLAMPAHSAQAEDAPNKGCEMLTSPGSRAKLSGPFEGKLMIKCGEISESALAAAQAQATTVAPFVEAPRRNDVR